MKLINVLKNTAYMLKLISKNTPFFIVSTIFINVWASLMNILLSVYLVKYVFDSLENGTSFLKILIIVGIMACLQIINNFVQAFFSNRVLPIQRLKLHKRLQTILFEKAESVELKCYDDPEYYNNFIFSLNEIDNRANNIVNQTGQFVSRVVSIITISSILFAIEPILILVTIIVVFFSAILQRKINKINFDRNMAMNEHIRKNDYFVRIFYLREYAKELRLSNIRVVLFKEFKNSTLSMNKCIRHYNTKIAIINTLKSILGSSFFQMGISVCFAFKMMIKNSMSLGQYATGTNAIWQLQGQLNGLINSYTSLYDNGQYIERVRCFLEYQPQIVSLEGKTIDPNKSYGIKFRNVSFGYSNSSSILKNVSFDINPGEKIAIVGLNGVGKSTLIKLLLRLYDPTEGEISLGEHDISHYDLDNYRKGFGVVFQDYNIYAATLSENVMMDAAVDSVIANHSLNKANIVIDDKKLNQVVTKEFDNEGLMFSGGEMQKVAIARIFAHPYHTLILDEASSSLDPIIEYDYNNSLLKALDGKTVVFISHRLSTTKMADKIFLLANGNIVESGTHQELMRINGKYADMFKKQAERYNA